jgi:hypothetical protein
MGLHSEITIGITATIEALSRLLTGLQPLEAIRFELEGTMALMVFQKPWKGTVFVLSGKLSAPKAEDLIRCGLSFFGQADSREEQGGFSFSTPDQTAQSASKCRPLLQAFADEAAMFTIQVISVTLNHVFSGGS